MHTAPKPLPEKNHLHARGTGGSLIQYPSHAAQTGTSSGCGKQEGARET
jgi:hypothetical protein